jgi:hypothetical protein
MNFVESSRQLFTEFQKLVADIGASILDILVAWLVPANETKPLIQLAYREPPVVEDASDVAHFTTERVVEQLKERVELAGKQRDR